WWRWTSPPSRSRRRRPSAPTAPRPPAGRSGWPRTSACGKSSASCSSRNGSWSIRYPSARGRIMFSARSPVRLTVPVKEPFDWHLTMTYPSRAYAHPIYRAEGDRLHRVVWLGRRPWRLTLGPARRHGKDWRLAVEGYPLRGEAPGAGAGAGNDGAAGGGADADSGAVAQALQDAVAQIVSADHDLAAMADAVAGDPVMARLVQRFQGLRILRMPSVFEGLADAIVGQQISVPAAHKIRLRLMTEFFPRAAAEPDFLPDPLPFPHPAAVAGADLDDLIRCGLIGRRAEYLAGVARLAV